MLNVNDDRKYINMSHLAILARLVLFPEEPIVITYLKEYISEDIDDNIRCMDDLKDTLHFLVFNYIWGENLVENSKDSQIILDIINRIANKQTEMDDYKKSLTSLRNENKLGVEISIREGQANDAKIWLETYIENYKNGRLKGPSNTYKFTYNLKTFLKFLDNSNYELSGFYLDSYDTELNLPLNKILETILYLNNRKYLSVYDFKILPSETIHLQGNRVYNNEATDVGPINHLSESYLRWGCTLEFKALPVDIWRQETIKRDALLTEQEWNILQIIMLKEKEIADKLCISNQTVNTHKKNIFKKLKVKNKREAYLFYERKGSKF